MEDERVSDEQGRHRVVAAVLVRPGGVLLCHRRAGRRWYPDCWDLPGGHIEDGETEREALARECAEELGIVVIDAVPLPFVLDDPTIHLTTVQVVDWEGTPANAAPEEHNAIAWCGVVDLATMPLADERCRPWLVDLLGERSRGHDDGTGGVVGVQGRT